MVILMYHAFGAPGERPSRFVVPGPRFARQMALLKWLGYRVLRLDEYLACRRDGRRPPARSVVITIDDGYADNRSVAYPILRRHGYPATIFLVANRVGATNDWTPVRPVAERPLLSWEDVREMFRKGIQFGAHTLTHPRLTSLPADVARREVVDSRLELARAIGGPVRCFAYPYGDCDEATRLLAAEAGFWGSCGTVSGRNASLTPVHDLRRIEIRGTDNLVVFAVKLWSGREVFSRRHTKRTGRRWLWRSFRPQW